MGDTKNNMKINNSTIFLKDIRCYAYHGVAPQENLIGNEYVIDLKLKVDISKAAQTDEVTDTVNYAEVHNVIKTEMAIPSKLLEHARVAESYKNFSRHFLILRKWSFAFLSGIHLWEQTLMPQALSCIVVENKRVSSLGYLQIIFFLQLISRKFLFLLLSSIHRFHSLRHDRLILETFRITGIVGMNTFVIRIHK